MTVDTNSNDVIINYKFLDWRIMMKKYDILIAKLFACCDVSAWPSGPVLIDTDKMSDLLEEIFVKEGLLQDENDK